MLICMGLSNHLVGEKLQNIQTVNESLGEEFRIIQPPHIITCAVKNGQTYIMFIKSQYTKEISNFPKYS